MVSRSYQNRLCGFGVDTLRFNPSLHFTGWTHVSIFLNTWHACIHTCIITSAWTCLPPTAMWPQNKNKECRAKQNTLNVKFLTKQIKVLFHNSRLFY